MMREIEIGRYGGEATVMCERGCGESLVGWLVWYFAKSTLLELKARGDGESLATEWLSKRRIGCQSVRPFEKAGG